MRWRGPIGSPPRPRVLQGQPAAGREQDGEEPADRDAAAAVRRPGNGTKRARIGKASGYTHRSFRPDAVRYMSVTTATHRPTVTHPDTWRDKKETARRAAFPQPAGRFRRWWQVLGSNQRRLSRRFYRPLPLATRATCRVPQRWRHRKDSPRRDHTVSGILVKRLTSGHGAFGVTARRRV